MTAQRIGLVVVHGVGSQQRYDLLKEFSAAFQQTLRQALAETGTAKAKPPQLLVDKVELNRRGERTRESSELYSFFGEPVPDAAARGNLFRPIRIRAGEDELSFYEAYWADEDHRYTLWQKFLFNLWLWTTLWNPIFNLFFGRYRRPPLSLVRVLWHNLAVLVIGLVYHVAELLILLLSFVLKKTELLRRAGEIVFEFAGDVNLYVSMRRFFHRQTKKDVLLARFDETLLKACLENDMVHVVGHSLGSVIAFDGLTRHRVHPSKMATAFLHFLQEDALPKQGKEVRVDLREKVRTLVTVGSPLDKFYFFWPSRFFAAPGRDERKPFQPPVLLAALPQSEEARPQLEAQLEEAAAPPDAERIRWVNAADIADPIGAKLDFFKYKAKEMREDKFIEQMKYLDGFDGPHNWDFAGRWTPAHAHTQYWEHPQFMPWLVKEFYPPARGLEAARQWEEAPTKRRPQDVPDSVGRGSRIVHGLASALLFLGSFLALWAALVPTAKFALRLLHDLYVDAESNSIYDTLGWMAVAIDRVRQVFALDQFELAVRTEFFAPLLPVALFFVLAMLVTAPFSWVLYKRSEKQYEEHHKEF